MSGAISPSTSLSASLPPHFVLRVTVLFFSIFRLEHTYYACAHHNRTQIRRSQLGLTMIICVPEPFIQITAKSTSPNDYMSRLRLHAGIALPPNSFIQPGNVRCAEVARACTPCSVKILVNVILNWMACYLKA